MPINSFLYPGAKTTPAYEVANSCRWNGADDPSMLKTSADGNQRTFTVSLWLKRCSISSFTAFYSQVTDDNNYFMMNFQGADTLNIHDLSSGSEQILFNTNAKFRDVSAWYHIVCAVDTTQATQGNRFKVWVNGTQITSFATSTYPDQNDDIAINVSGEKTRVGAGYDTANYHFNGYIAEVCSIDGTAYAASDFGEFDEDSPTIWKPIDVSGLTFGNNGFYLDFEDSGDLGDDESGNSLDFAETNLAAADQATDTPTNNFCTMNPLDNEYVDATFSEGNNQVVIASGIKTYATSTMGVSAGKWYWEVELGSSDGNDQGYGIADRVSTGASVDVYATGYPANYVYETQGRFIESETTNTDDAPDSYTSNDVMSFALDLDNDKIYYAKNGTWQDSGDPTSGATGTGAQSIKGTADADTSGFYFPICSSETTARGATWQFNFGGCSAFAVSSANQDGNGYGNFEYSVPSGYLALCTKNLGSDGG